MADPVITRFAPSPTGHLHVGGARTALFCWALARRARGRFVLRIEDTDQARSSDAAASGILDDLAWLGIHWDDGPEHAHGRKGLGGDERGVGPFHQAQRLDLYNEHINRLIESDAAYPAFETPDELESKRKEAIAAKVGYRYDRAALGIPREERTARLAAGEEHVVRLRMPEEPITVHDTVLGDVTVGPDEFDDFIIRKRDGFPTYHLAVVVDDALMGVTHVLRGQEHLINTPRHIALQRALALPTPTYAHMPLIFNPDGSKMSKRDKDKAAKKACKDAGVDAPPVAAVSGDEFARWMKDKTRQLPSDQLRELASAVGVTLPEIDVEDFRRAGYLPGALCNFLALLGWNPKQKTADGKDLETFDLDFLAANFDVKGIGKGQAKFDRAKLLSFNADAIGRLEDAEFARTWRDWARAYDPGLVSTLGDEKIELFAPAVKPRCKTLADGRSVVQFALVADDAFEFDGKAVHKALLKGDAKGLELLKAFAASLDAIESWDAPAIDAAVEAFAGEHGVGLGKIAQPLRVAVTGAGVSPPLGVTLAVLGRDGVRARIDRCVAFAAAAGSSD